MVSGTPMAMPNWKIHNIIESAGGIVVNEENCIGTRYFSPDCESVIDVGGQDSKVINIDSKGNVKIFL